MELRHRNYQVRCWHSRCRSLTCRSARAGGACRSAARLRGAQSPRQRVEAQGAAGDVCACVAEPSRLQGEGGPVQERLYRSTKLWAFFVDLEANLGNLDSTKARPLRVPAFRHCAAECLRTNDRPQDRDATDRAQLRTDDGGYAHHCRCVAESHVSPDAKFFEDSYRVFEKVRSLCCCCCLVMSWRV